MKKVFTFLSLCITLLASAQTSFQALVNTSSTGSTLDQLTQLKDGSYISVGTAYNTSNSIVITKLDAGGNFLYSKSFTASGRASSNFITSTSDGGFAVSSLIGFKTISLMKFTSNLSLQWSKQYSTPTTFTVNSNLIETRGGYLLAVGVYKGNNYYGPNAALLKTDSLGNVQFLKTYFHSTFNYIYNVAATADKNYVFVSRIDSFPVIPVSQSCITKISPDGTPIWSTATATSTQSTGGTSLLVTTSGDIVVGGTTTKRILVDNGDGFEYANREQVLITKYNASGSRLWSERMQFAENANNHTLFMKQDSQGNYLLCGYINQYQNTYSTGSYTFRMSIDTAGKWLWTKKKGEQGAYTAINSLIATQDGGFIAGGNGKYNGATGSLFCKFNSDAETCGTGTADSTETIDTLGTAAVQPTTVTDVAVTASSLSVTVDSAGSGTLICSGSVLPIQLLSFAALANNKQVAVSWTTANEINADYYTVERSGNGSAFTPLQTIAAKGNSAGTQTYTTTDASPMPGTSYYRLKEMDKNGAVTYSAVATVVFSGAGTFVISPNPVVSNIRALVQSGAAGKAILQVSDMAGKLLFTQSIMVNEGMNTITLPVSSLMKGVYVMKMIQNNRVQSVKFVKE